MFANLLLRQQVLRTGDSCSEIFVGSVVHSLTSTAIFSSLGV